MDFMATNPPPCNPFQSPTSGPDIAQQGATIVLGEIKAQAITSLVVGILSIFCLGIILAPFAIYRGAKAKRLIASSGMGSEHLGMAQAGFVIGIISLVLNIIGVLFLILNMFLAMNQ
jgi:hypothetical protein